MKKVLVIDGNSILNRQFYGSRPLTTKSGIYTNATLGFVKALISQIEAYKPDFCAVAFDLKAPTFRHKQYAEYKAGRHAMPEELAVQFPYAKKFIRVLGIRELSLEGFEADDILGTVAAMADECGYETRIMTGDKDSLQLISDKSAVLLAANNEYKLMDESAFLEKYGISPSQFVDVKALMGDSSDNIPGVAGIGEKTALKLIAEHGDLEGVFAYAEAEASKPKVPSVIAKLNAGRESAFTSRFLATIVRDVPVIESLSEIALGEYDKKELLALCTELEFVSLISKLSPSDDDGWEKDESNSGCTAEEVSLDDINGFDTKKTLAVFFNEAGGTVSFSDGEKCFFIKGGIANLLPVIEKGMPLIVFDAKSLLHEICALGGEESKINIEYDALLAAYVIDSSLGANSPDRIFSAFLGEIPNEKNGGELLYRLYTVTKEQMQREGTYSLYNDIEYPLAFTLFKMEREGFMVDIASLRDMGAALDKTAIECMEAIYSSAGKEFNVNSPKQLGEVLFETLGLPAPKKTKTGYSTSAEVLEKLAPYHPIIEKILAYRQVTKLRSTYVDGLMRAADEKGRVHTTFTQTVTATGRLSSVEPNLQNIPVRTELGREMRRCFVAGEGKVLVDADYSQIELRILAAISGDAVMTDAFNRGEDIHTVTASQVFNTPVEEVTDEMRKKAKAVNFGIVYGMGEYSLAGDIHVSMSKAAEYIKNYKEKYMGVATYLSDAVERAKRDGYVTTLLGRRRSIPDITSPKRNIRAFGERVAMNSPIQGTAADIIKIAMLKVEKRLAESGIDARLILQVHDELIIEAPSGRAEEVKELLVNEMENALLLPVPLTVSASIGKTWYDCK